MKDLVYILVQNDTIVLLISLQFTRHKTNGETYLVVDRYNLDEKVYFTVEITIAGLI